MQYDPDGYVTNGWISGQGTALNWDYDHNLTSAGQISFTYDLENRLSGWQTPTTTNQFITLESDSGSKILVNQSSSGSTTRYVYGAGLLYDDTDGQIQVYHFDPRGNTVALSAASGLVTGTIDYGPFGEILSRTGSTATPFQYDGLDGVVTAPNGLNNMRFRWYSADMKRFISPDSIKGDLVLPGSLNHYAYAGNDPINYRDPKGEALSFLIGAAAGAVIGAAVELITDYIEHKKVDWNDLGAAVLSGAAAGGLSAIGFPAIGGTVGSLVTSVWHDAAHDANLNSGSLWLHIGETAAETGYVSGLFSAGAQAFNDSRAVGIFTENKAFTSFSAKLEDQEVSQAYAVSLFRAARSAAKSPLRRLLTGPFPKYSIGFGAKLLSSLAAQHATIPPDGGSRNVAGPPTRVGAIISGAVAGSTSYIGQNGEYYAQKQYFDALNAALVPLPDTQNHLTPF